MNLDQLTSLAASGGQLALGLAVLRQRTRSPVAPPLVLLCALHAAWTFCALAYSLSGDLRWHFADVMFSPMVLPATLHVILAFTGKVRRFRLALAAAYIASAALACSSVLAFGVPGAVSFVESSAWSVVFLLIEGAVVTASAVLLVQHLRDGGPQEERARARLILVALLSASILGATELSDDLGLPVRPLGNLATLAAAVLLALASVRHRLLDRRMRAAEALAALLVASAIVVGLIGLVSALRAQVAELVIGTAVLVAIASVVAFQLWVGALRQRRRLSNLALAGRLGEQLAHDLKNPLGALRGAIQFLDEERARGGSLDQHAQMLGLMTDQVDRIVHVIEDYQRIGRVEPLRSRFDLHALVQKVTALQPFASSGSVVVRTELAADPASCYADPDLVGLALENLLRNASEAMPEGGSIHIRTRVACLAGTPAIALAVEDTGVGMDARQRERAFDQLYTTKPGGTGLGLAFVKRVAEAQGGSARLTSAVGHGTSVELLLPVGPDEDTARDD